MTPTAPRFYSQGGQLFADRRPVSLEWAEEHVTLWWKLGHVARLSGNDRLADEYRRQGTELHRAMREAERWQRASGPNAAEAYTNKVRQMLKASVEHDRRA